MSLWTAVWSIASRTPFAPIGQPTRSPEPLITFYHGVMRPIWSDLAHTRNPARLWERSEPRFTSNVLGPHFEQLCRYWTRYFASEEITGGFPARVEPGTVNDPASKKTRQIEVA